MLDQTQQTSKPKQRKMEIRISLNGTKRWITNANIANLFTVFARTDQSQKGSSGVSAFLIDANTPGISLGSKYKKMGQQSAHVCDVIFDNCRVQRGKHCYWRSQQCK